jgi:hypothetical protein
MLLPPAGAPGTSVPDYIPIPAKSPYTGRDDATVLVSRAMIDDLEAKGQTRAFYDAYLLPDAVENPVVILEGLNRTGFQNGFCYCSVPKTRWLDEQTKMPVPPLKVFVVLVAPVGNDLHVLHWEWRFVDLKRPGYPKKWNTDFVRQAWPPTN